MTTEEKNRLEELWGKCWESLTVDEQLEFIKLSKLEDDTNEIYY